MHLCSWIRTGILSSFVVVANSWSFRSAGSSHDRPAKTGSGTANSRRQLLAGAIAGLITSGGTAARPVWALAPEQAASDYDVYAANYDQLDGGKASSMLGIEEARSKLMSQASGHVLEIGAGTGLNLDKYNPQKLKSLTLVDISSGMLREANTRATSLAANSEFGNIPIKFVQADATSELVDLFGEEAFDTVVDSFSLCVMGNEGAQQCLQQIRRVVKTGTGQILLLENSRSTNPVLGLYQDATSDAAASVGGKGCVYNQNVEAMIRASGQLVIDKEDLYAAGLFRAFQVSRL